MRHAFREGRELAFAGAGLAAGISDVVNDKVLEVMAEGSGGYPSFFSWWVEQTWRMHPAKPTISLHDARVGVYRARRRPATLIHEPALSAASDVDM